MVQNIQEEVSYIQQQHNGTKHSRRRKLHTATTQWYKTFKKNQATYSNNTMVQNIQEESSYIQQQHHGTKHSRRSKLHTATTQWYTTFKKNQDTYSNNT